MYRRALVAMTLVAAAVTVVGGGTLALFGLEHADAAPAAQEVLFDVGEAGSVIVRSDGTEVALVSVSTSDGWSHQITQDSGGSVNVAFSAAAGMGIDFRAGLDDASIVGRIRIVAAPGPVSDSAAPVDRVTEARTAG